MGRQKDGGREAREEGERERCGSQEHRGHKGAPGEGATRSEQRQDPCGSAGTFYSEPHGGRAAIRFLLT